MRWRITFEPQLPYAIYQEAIAHLQQLPNLQVASLPRQGAFDYLASPIAHLELQWHNPTDLGLVSRILQHYGTFTIADLETQTP